MNNTQDKIICLVETGWYNPSSSNNQSGGSFFVKDNTSSTVVNDPSVKSNSRIFVTFKDKVGSEFWISNIDKHSFVINLDKPVTKDIPFDYFVDNATATTKDKDKEDSLVKNKNEKQNDSTSNGANDNVESKAVSVATEEDLKVPPIPPDPSKNWKYTNGVLVEYTPQMAKRPNANDGGVKK